MLKENVFRCNAVECLVVTNKQKRDTNAKKYLQKRDKWKTSPKIANVTLLQSLSKLNEFSKG